MRTTLVCFPTKGDIRLALLRGSQLTFATLGEPLDTLTEKSGG